ncbi:MAG: hypothetical protein WA395_11660 [Nitrososphaeraceae archaeon]
MVIIFIVILLSVNIGTYLTALLALVMDWVGLYPLGIGASTTLRIYTF